MSLYIKQTYPIDLIHQAQDHEFEDFYQTKTPCMEEYQRHQRQLDVEEVHLQEDSQEEDSQVGGHQEVEDHRAAEDYREEEEHHLFHLPQSRCKALTSSLAIHCMYSQEIGPNPKNLSHNGRCMKGSTSPTT
jgi:hypothetical protein